MHFAAAERKGHKYTLLLSRRRQPLNTESSLGAGNGMNRDKNQAKYRSAMVGAKDSKKGNRIVQWARERLVTLILLATMFVGVCLLAYPSFADYWNSFHQERAVMAYAENVASMNDEEYESIIEKARAYNADLAESGIRWMLTEEEKEAYRNQLNISESGIMGYIKIHKIGITLPIYHGTDEKILQTSIGHLEESSLPVGGESSHCMLSGHRGLPSAKLFTDLDKLKEGDTFTLTVLNETLTYEVDRIWIVKPENLSHLQIEEGKDYCTLITCTPYGINTHRLLVRGHRINNLNGNAMVVADAIQIRPVYIAPFLSVPVLILLLIYVLISTSVTSRKRKDYKQKYLDESGIEEAEIEDEERDMLIETIQKLVKK